MDAIVKTCLNCGAPLKEPRKLNDFCDYSCRGQHAVNTLAGVPHRGAYSGSKNLKKTRALHTLRKQSLGAITFCKINSVTYRIDHALRMVSVGSWRSPGLVRLGRDGLPGLVTEQASHCPPRKRSCSQGPYHNEGEGRAARLDQRAQPDCGQRGRPSLLDTREAQLAG
jgi:hypothetical protein